MKIYGFSAYVKTKPNKANSNPILAQNWVRFSRNWL